MIVSIYRWLSSLQMGLILGGVIVAVTLIGTLLTQEMADRYFYTQPWFFALLTLFILNLVLCTSKSFRRSVKYWGIFLTHLGIIVVALGGGVSRFAADKGTLWLQKGKSASSFTTDQGKEIPLGFSLRLEDFSIVYYHPRIQVISPEGATLTSLEALPGMTLDLQDYHFEIERFFADYARTRKVLPGTDRDPGPARQVQVLAAGSDEVLTENWLVSWKEKEEPWAVTWMETDWSYRNCGEPGEKEKVLQAPAPASSQKIVVRLLAGTPGISPGEKSFPPEKGVELDLPPLHLAVDEYCLDFARREEPRHKQQRSNPAVKVRVTGKTAEENRWVFALYPDFDGMHGKKNKELELVFTGDDSQPNLYRVRLVEEAGGKLTAAFWKNGIPADSREIKPAERCPVGLTGYEFRVGDRLEHVRIEEKEEDLAARAPGPRVAEEGQVAVRAPGPRVAEEGQVAARVRIKGPDGEHSFLVYAHAEQPLPFANHTLGLALTCQSDIKSFQSQVTVLDRDKSLLQKLISVNDPLSFRGFRFYQASYKQEDLTWTGLQVSRDPGTTVVFAGFILVVIGLFMVSFISTWWTRKT